MKNRSVTNQMNDMSNHIQNHSVLFLKHLFFTHYLFLLIHNEKSIDSMMLLLKCYKKLRSIYYYIDDKIHEQKHIHRAMNHLAAFMI